MVQASPSIDQALCAEHTRQHARVLPLSLLLSTVLLLVLATALWVEVSRPLLAAWVAAVMATALVRVAVHVRGRQDRLRDPSQPRWRRRYRLALALQGIAWALGGAFLLQVQLPASLDLLIYGLAGLAFGALMTVGFDRVAAALYGGPMVLPFVAYLLWMPVDRLPASLLVVALLLPLGLLAMVRTQRALRSLMRVQVALGQRVTDLQQAARQLDRTGAVAGVGGWELDAATRALVMSDHGARLLGLPAGADRTLQAWLDRLGAAQAQALRQAIERALSHGDPLSLQLTLSGADGNPRQLRVEAQPRHGAGRVVGLDGALLDITREHEAHRALARQHAMLDQLMHTARQGVWFTDRDGRTTDLNAAMLGLLARPREAVVGQPARDMLDPATDAALQAAGDGAADGPDASAEVDLTRPDGSVRRCLVHRSPLRDEAGLAAGWVAVWTDITERHEAERALRIAQIVINASAEMISVADEHNVYHMVNDAWVQNTGLRRDEVIGRPAAQVMPQNLRGDREAAARTCIEEGRRVTVRGLAVFPGQPSRTVVTDFYPIRVDRRGARLAALFTRDVTQEEAQHQALVTATELLRGALDATGEAIFATDASSDAEPPRFANEQLYRLWRVPDEVRRAPTVGAIGALMYASETDADASRARVNVIVAAGVPAEDRIALRDGRVLVRRFASVPLHDRTLRVWSFRDVTAEVRAIEAREAVAAEQRSLFENFPGYIAVLDEQLHYRHVNERLAALWGRTPTSIIGRGPAEVLGDLAWRRLLHVVDRAMLSGRAVSESHYEREGGDSAIDLEVTHVAGPRHADGSRSIFAFGVDITERKHAQAALIDALAEAERANAAKSRFLSHMSHELRTPLNAVLGFGQLLAAQPLSTLQRHQVDEVLRGGRHLLALINDLLDLGRIESGALDVSCEAVDPFEACRAAAALLAPMAGERQVEPRLPERPLDSGVWADPRRLQQVLLNLLSNAIKYNRRGGHVAVELERCDGEVELRVVDDGPGLTVDEQQRLFRPFERLHPASSEGTGIGLALSRHLVEAMGGRIGVHSRPGAGSTFWFRLAASARPAPASPAQAPTPLPGPAPDAAAPPSTRARALYIEDNPVNLMLVAAMLEEELDLTTEADPARGLALALDMVPDLVLLDIQLPGMDGYEVLRRLRADPRTRGIPVVAVSANAMPSDLAAGRAAGFDAYVTKPVDLDTLVDTVRRALTRTLVSR